MTNLKADHPAIIYNFEDEIKVNGKNYYAQAFFDKKFQELKTFRAFQEGNDSIAAPDVTEKSPDSEFKEQIKYALIEKIQTNDYEKRNNENGALDDY